MKSEDDAHLNALLESQDNLNENSIDYLKKSTNLVKEKMDLQVSQLAKKRQILE